MANLWYLERVYIGAIEIEAEGRRKINERYIVVIKGKRYRPCEIDVRDE